MEKLHFAIRLKIDLTVIMGKLISDSMHRLYPGKHRTCRLFSTILLLP